MRILTGLFMRGFARIGWIGESTLGREITMKNIAITGICLLCCLNLTSCLETGDVNKDEVQTLNSTIGYVASNPQSDASDRSLPSPDYYKNQLAFSSELSAAYLFSDFEKNMLISPISVRYAFAALSEGAGPNLSGDFTRLLHKGKKDVFQTENALHKTYLNSYFDPNEKNLGLMVQDSIWIDDELKNIKPDFPDKASKFHHSEVFHADLNSEKSANAINEWVKKATNNLIDPQKKPDPDSMLIIMNTIYFKDAWKDAFDKSSNTKDVFTTSSGKEVETEFMRNTVTHSFYTETSDYRIACLNFTSGSCYKVLLPKEGKNLEDLAKADPADLVLQFLSAQPDKPAIINWNVPISEVDSDINLKELLISMGYESIFSDKADYSLISDTPLTVGSAIQLTSLKLDNEGVEAAAYTEIKMGVTSVPIQEDETIDMNLNKPYLFSIEFQDGTPLFVGVMNMP